MTPWPFEVIKMVKATFNDPVTILGHKLGQSNHEGNRDLWGHKVGHGDLLWLRGVIN